MRKSIYIIFLSFIITNSLSSQGGSIVQDLNQPKKGEGNVQVYQDDSITRVVSSQSAPSNTSSAEEANSTTKTNTASTTVKGSTKGRHRVQIFHGNSQTSRREAERRRDLVKGRFPQLNVTVSYSAPSWAVSVGGFASKADAERVKSELQAAFPSFGREMYVR